MSNKTKRISSKTLTRVLSKMLGVNIVRASFKTKQLQGGTVGNVRLVTGLAETVHGAKLPYRVVLKIQKKWERYGDIGSWRREYDLYASDIGTLCTDSILLPECYHAEINAEENETRLWMEYIDGISGRNLTMKMLECAALELGRWQGKIYAEKPSFWLNMSNLRKPECLKNWFLYRRSWKETCIVFDYLRSGSCDIPKHLRDMLILSDDNSDQIWTRIEKLPVVMIHGDFWLANIFSYKNKIILLDWDSSGWGYLGEDIAQLVTDEVDVQNIAEYCREIIPAYYKGFSEYADVSQFDYFVYEMLPLILGCGIVKCYMNSKSQEEKALQINILQQIYELKK